MLKNKIILITGAAGFIGSSLTEKLLENNNYLILIDNFNDYYSGKRQQLSEILNKYEDTETFQLIEGNILNESLFNEIKQPIDYIFHLAAQAGVRYSLKHSAEVAHNNITGCVNIYELALKQGKPKVVYASSSSVYGNPIYTPVDESHPKNPISPYAVSKLTGEIYADYYYREYNLPITSLRFYTVYGPRGRPDMAIRKFFDLMLQDKDITIYGDGSQIRDFTYVSDIVNGLILAAERQKASGEVFNLGCSNPIEVNKLVDIMYEISGKERKIKFSESQKGDVDITSSDIKKAQRLLGFKPQISIQEGLEKQFEWQKNLLLKKH
ncbi:MAG: NAD-dependent epimerase/dehydratase family protein [Promethearchaeota archaeon]|nr:MAG: NAD-dependent epimerase/dehydratase family protein [Candidatus Lokiarchaeota archaeon]